nr:bifunctional hydroxymethylpyrimidine kinase/phosphomethylpyrimidine kinase [Blautia sp. An249]
MKKMKTVLSIAGSDCSGGAGIQADLKTMQANGVYGMSVVTALTAQNTRGVAGIYQVEPEFLKSQLDCIFTDIYPDAVKIGMIPTGALIEAVAEKLKQYQASNVVADPVMVSTSGSSLMEQEAVAAMKEKLFPLASLLTPNIPEAEVLSGLKIESAADMKKAARMIAEECGCAVLCKGGHGKKDAEDLLYIEGKFHWYREERIDNPNTHGTGCTLSSAIASNLAKGYPLPEAISRAKAYLTGALRAMLDLGEGSGPLHHGYELRGTWI